jgi:hypothetical protein
MDLHTEFDFVLPLGFKDSDGSLHRLGRMRLATALDEIESLQNPKVQNNEAYLPVVLLSRVVTRLGDMPELNLKVIENLFATDLAYLEDLYMRINRPEQVVVLAVCPHCSSEFQLQIAPLTNAAD